jgi:ATP-binding cassette, subfamily F, member 3
MITITDLSFAYSDKPLLEGVSFSIGDHQKIGLVGPNGAGKTTLLKIILGEEKIELGKVEVVGKIELVPQEIKYDPVMENSCTVRQYLDIDMVIQESVIRKILAGLEMADLDLDLNPRLLSGGQKTKLALARALLAQPNILLLDEPTNFLDTDGKNWVMDFLSKYPKTVILISHDLDLLDQHIDKVLALNPLTKNIEEYKGNYSKYLKVKKERDELLKKQILEQHKKVERMEESLHALSGHSSAKGVRQRVIMQRRVKREREKLPEIPKTIKNIKITLPEPEWVGSMPLRVEQISKSYGENQVIKNVSFAIERGEKIALIGPNGSGKSTLNKILVGDLEPDSGEVIKDSKLKIGYYSQELEFLPYEKRICDLIAEQLHSSINSTRPFLAKLLFTDNKIFQTIKTLSGGEKTRLAIGLILLRNYNLLILDEPTTYLDVMSVRIILEMLKSYTGTLIIVSHNQEFMEELKPDKALLLPENRFAFWTDALLEKIGQI